MVGSLIGWFDGWVGWMKGYGCMTESIDGTPGRSTIERFSVKVKDFQSPSTIKVFSAPSLDLYQTDLSLDNKGNLSIGAKHLTNKETGKQTKRHTDRKKMNR